MSKTRTTIVNADILNSKINTENYNNVYPIDTPIFNKLDSIPNSLGKLTSYDLTWTSGYFRKLNDTGYIDYQNGTLKDEKGNSAPVVNPIQVEDTILPSKFIDITKHYHIKSDGLYKNDGTRVSRQIYDKYWSIYEISDVVIVIKNSSIYADPTECHIYINGTVTTKIINAAFTEKWAYDDDSHIYNISNNQVLYWINILGSVGQQDLKSISTSYPTKAFCSGMIEVRALPKFYHKTVGKRMQLEALPEYHPEVIYVSSGTQYQTVMSYIDLKFDTNGFVIKSDTKNMTYPTFLSPSQTPSYSITSQSDNPKCFKVGYNQSSGRAYYIQAAPSNKHFRRMFDTPDNRTCFTGIQSEKDVNEDLFYYYEYGHWKLITFDGKKAVTYDDHLVVPFGFIDNIYELTKTGLVYINSIDQQAHYVSVNRASTKFIFKNVLDININNFDNKMIINPFENEEYYQTLFAITTGNNPVLQTPVNGEIKTHIVVGNNINYMKINNNLTLPTDGKYVIDKKLVNYASLRMTGFGEVYFFKNGEPSQEYSTIPLAYQSETSADLSDMEVERNIALRQPIVNGGKLTKLTPSRYILKYADATFALASLGGTVLPAFDLTAESIVASDDTVDNVISLRGNLYTIKNNSIYGVSSDFKDLSYISSLGRMKYICNNDNLMLFYDDVLKCLVSFDASNSWNVFLNIPLLKIYQGTISNQNEIVLFTNRGVLFSRNNTMSLVDAETITEDSLLSSNGIEFAVGTHIYSPGTRYKLKLETSWLGMVDCRRLFQLDSIYFEFDTTDTKELDFDLSIDMLVDDEVKAGEFSYNVEQVGNLKYIRVQPTVQKCNAFKYSLSTNAAIKRISYSITTDDELQTVTAPVIQEIKF